TGIYHLAADLWPGVGTVRGCAMTRNDAIDLIIRKAVTQTKGEITQSQYDAIMEKIAALGVDPFGMVIADRQLHRLAIIAAGEKPRDVCKLPYAIPLPKHDRSWESGLMPASEFIALDIPPRESLLVDKDAGGTLFYASSVNEIFAFRGIGKSVV